jgi:hypothetical protein
MGSHAAIAAAGIAGSVGLWLLGQNDASLPSSVTEIGPVVLGAGAGAWFLRWFMSTYIPQIQQQHKEQIDQLANAHTTAMATVAGAHEKTINNIVTEFRSETKDQRANHAEEINRILSIYQDRPADATRPANVRNT